jgi:pimeloyl-ACP methyl ester carboxylesterase
MTPPVLLLAHGAGSTAEFLRRAFPSAVVGARVRVLQDRTGDARRIAAALVAAACTEPGPVVVGGVSVGAHGAALAAAELGDRAAGLLAVMPAGLGPAPLPVLRLAAEEVARVGAAAVLHRLRTYPATREDWVTTELLAAWPGRPTLAAELAAAAEGAPDADDLAQLPLPALVLGLREDPVHPAAVAQAWAQALPGSRYVELARHAPSRRRDVLGAAVAGWVAATGSR